MAGSVRAEARGHGLAGAPDRRFRRASIPRPEIRPPLRNVEPSSGNYRTASCSVSVLAIGLRGFVLGLRFTEPLQTILKGKGWFRKINYVLTCLTREDLGHMPSWNFTLCVVLDERSTLTKPWYALVKHFQITQLNFAEHRKEIKFDEKKWNKQL